MGGGSHGHLGLVVTPQVYATIAPNSPYIRPILPTLQVTPTDTQYVIAQKRHQYAEDLQMFRETNAVERAIIQQIISSIEDKYLKAIKSKFTNSINKKIPGILSYLFDTNGDISPREFSALKSQVESMTFDPTEPIDTVFTEVDDLANIAESANKPLPDDQKIDMAYIILQNTRKFTSGLREWDKMQLRNATQAQANGIVQPTPSWDEFKDHFRTVQKGLRKTGELTIENTFNKDELMSMVSEGIKNGLEQAMSVSDTSTLTTENTDDNSVLLQQQQQKIEHMNVMIRKLENEKQMQWQQNTNKWNNQMQQMPMWPYCFPLTSQQNNSNQFQPQFIPRQFTNTSTNDTNNNNNAGNTFQRYCWSCGLGNHWGRKCTKKKEGHKNNASWQNKMGGRTKVYTPHA